MSAYRITLQTLTAFGTPLAGDTLFGQLCWTLRHLHGAARLNALLEGYTVNRPFLVISDAFPAGFIPLPTLPARFWTADPNAERKALKKKCWLPARHLARDLAEWQSLAVSDAKVLSITGMAFNDQTGKTRQDENLSINTSQPHNTINRMTGTTGKNGFAPYSVAQLWYHPDARHELYVVLDQTRLSLDELLAAIAYIGATGYGRDASIGLGKFQIVPPQTPFDPVPVIGANAWLTLGAIAPQGQGFCADKSYYQSMTRFGRHGSAAALSGQPFKRPVLLAKSGAVFAPLENFCNSVRFIGQGLGGVSHAQPEAVQQGYAPVIPICLPAHREGQEP